MKHTIKTIAAFILCLGAVKIQAQGFTNSSPVYSTPSLLGLNTTPLAGTQLNIYTPDPVANGIGINIGSPVNTHHGSNIGIQAIQANPNGKILSYVGTSGIWAAQQTLAGVNASVNYVTGLINFDNTKTSAAYGGYFTADVNNPVAGFGTGNYNIAGVAGTLTGVTSNYPANVIMGAGVFNDQINAAGTFAGYFNGKGYFSGNVGIGTTAPGSNLHVQGSDNPAIFLSALIPGGGGATASLQTAMATCGGCYSPHAGVGDAVIRPSGKMKSVIFSTNTSHESNTRNFTFADDDIKIMQIWNGGNVQIGNVTTPAGYKLFVEQGISVQGSSNPGISIAASVPGGTATLQTVIATCGGCYSVHAGVGDAVIRPLGQIKNVIFTTSTTIDSNTRSFTFADEDKKIMQIWNGGKVQIGNVSTPAGYKLFVEQGILTEKVKVAMRTSGNWSDYVFANDYRLKPLSEVEAFVKENKHLPNVPSAEELVRDGGIDVNQMFAKQMEKIEELTLYIIGQNKRLEILEKENSSLKSLVTNLKK